MEERVFKINYILLDENHDEILFRDYLDLEGNTFRTIYSNGVIFVSAEDLYRGLHIKEPYKEVLEDARYESNKLALRYDCDKSMYKKVEGVEYISLFNILEIVSRALGSGDPYIIKYIYWLTNLVSFNFE